MVDQIAGQGITQAQTAQQAGQTSSAGKVDEKQTIQNKIQEFFAGNKAKFDTNNNGVMDANEVAKITEYMNKIDNAKRDYQHVKNTPTAKTPSDAEKLCEKFELDKNDIDTLTIINACGSKLSASDLDSLRDQLNTKTVANYERYSPKSQKLTAEVSNRGFLVAKFAKDNGYLDQLQDLRSQYENDTLDGNLMEERSKIINNLINDYCDCISSSYGRSVKFSEPTGAFGFSARIIDENRPHNHESHESGIDFSNKMKQSYNIDE